MNNLYNNFNMFLKDGMDESIKCDIELKEDKNFIIYELNKEGYQVFKKGYMSKSSYDALKILLDSLKLKNEIYQTTKGYAVNIGKYTLYCDNI